MMKPALALVYLLSIPGAPAWAQVARVEAVPVLSPAASAPAAFSATALPASALAAPRLYAPASAPASALPAAPFAAAPAAFAAASAAESLVAPAAFAAPAAGPAPNADAAPNAAAAAPAAAPAEGRTVHGAAAYRVQRFLLSSVAALTGAVNSLPSAGPALTDRLIARAESRRVVLSDYDDTLSRFNAVLPDDMVAAVTAVRAAGKEIAVISDRSDEKRGAALTVFESLSSLPVETRSGMYVAANSGGRVYRYDAQGVPQRVFEAPAMSDAFKSDVAAAAAAAKARLAEVGAVLHDGVGNVPAESWGPYSYALMLEPGSSEAAVRGAAALLQEELDRRGVEIEVAPRFAKDPANPPYVTLSIVTKEGAARFIAEALKAGPRDVVIVGDSMYAPHAAKKGGWLAALGPRLSGRALPALGNRSDANMERGVPGALTLAVGGSADPRAGNVAVLGGKGPELTRRILESVAARPASEGGERSRVVDVVAAALLLAAVAGAYGAFIHGFGQWVQEIEGLLHGAASDAAVDGAALFGGALGLRGVSAKKRAASEAKPAAARRGLARETRDAIVGGILLIAVLAGLGAFVTVGANWLTEGMASVEQSLHQAAAEDDGHPF